MSVDLESRFLREPAVLPGQVALGKLDHIFQQHDEAPMGYWKKPDGHVILSQYGDNGTEKKLDREFVRLGKYGSYASAAIANLKDPLLPLVLAGGLQELPPDQIKLLGWHRVPDRAAKRSHREVDALVQAAMATRGISREEAVLVVMPQLVGFDLTEYTCVSHPGRYFPTEGAKRDHDSVMHKESLQAEATGKAVAAAQGGAAQAAAASSATTDALVALIAQQGEVIAQMRQQLADLTTGASGTGEDSAEPAARRARR